MEELISVTAFFAGIPILLIGWIWSIIKAKKIHIGWAVSMFALFPLPLLPFSLLHWHQAKGPLVLSITGIALVTFTIVNVQ